MKYIKEYFLYVNESNIDNLDNYLLKFVEVNGNKKNLIAINKKTKDETIIGTLKMEMEGCVGKNTRLITSYKKVYHFDWNKNNIVKIFGNVNLNLLKHSTGLKYAPTLKNLKASLNLIF